MVDSTADLVFPSMTGKPVTCRFDGGELTSDAGVLLLAQADRRLGLLRRMADAIADRREQAKVTHALVETLRARVFAIACGYEDANDLDRLRQDPALKAACGKLPGTEGALASQPSISRLENAVTFKDLMRAGRVLAEAVIHQLPRETTQIVLDIDATEDPCHGQQEFEFFNGFYDAHCYLPLLVYVTGADGRQRLLAALLRPGTAGSTQGVRDVLRRAVRLLRARFPDVPITLRADAGFGNAAVIALCERLGIQFVLALQRNKRLQVLSTPCQMDAAIKHGRAGDGCREYAEFLYKAGTWATKQRVIVKAEVTRGELNPRFVVTNRADLQPEALYAFYCARGDRENRIKEFKLDLCSGRTSCHRFVANQFRLLLHAAASILMTALQHATLGTRWSSAQVQTLRLRLLKVGARVVETCRTIWVHLPTSYPERAVWHHMYHWLLRPVT